jgi:hypothetical protein
VITNQPTLTPAFARGRRLAQKGIGLRSTGLGTCGLRSEETRRRARSYGYKPAETRNGGTSDQFPVWTNRITSGEGVNPMLAG